MERYGRRKFLQLSAAGAAGVAAAPSIAGALGANEQVRVGVLGIRGRGRAHARELAGLKNVEVVTLCDVDSRLFDDRVKMVADIQGKAPSTVEDCRRVLEDKSVDVISIGAPDHWHGPMTIYGCQAGKDVYVEKPCSHNIREGRLMIEAARKYDRIVQHGTQSRSGESFVKAREFVRSGKLGTIRMAKVINSQLRANIGHENETEVPAGVNYDLWLGPAPKRPFSPNRFHYNWHWHWDYGTGDMGNDGVHAIDYARWFLGVEDPVSVSAMGTKLHFDDDQETPDTQIATFDFGDRYLVYEMHIWTNYQPEGFENGAVLYGTEGNLAISPRGWKVTWSGNKAGPSSPGSSRSVEHFQNFIDCVRSRKTPIADIREGHLSSRLAHLANIATRLGRSLNFDPKTETFVGDADANAMLTRQYREPFVLNGAV